MGESICHFMPLAKIHSPLKAPIFTSNGEKMQVEEVPHSNPNDGPPRSIAVSMIRKTNIEGSKIETLLWNPLNYNPEPAGSAL